VCRRQLEKHALIKFEKLIVNHESNICHQGVGLQGSLK
jgi:hypothetical protein